MIEADEKKSTPNRLNVVLDWFEELKRSGVMNKSDKLFRQLLPK